MGQLFPKLLKAAEKEGSEAWFAIGHGYCNGWGAAQDRVAARAWFKRAAEEGHTRAMVRLALNLTTPGSLQDLVSSIKWLQQAAELKDPSAMIHLGFLYRDGVGVETDSKAALAWFTKAFETGESHAAIYIGRMYSSYLSSPAEAKHWFEKAAASGQSAGCIELANLYNKRDCDLYEPSKAVHWCHRAVQLKGSSAPNAMFKLAGAYLNGHGVSQDKTRCLEWLEKIIETTPDYHPYHRKALEMKKTLGEQFL